MKANIETERKYPGNLKQKIEAVYQERGKRDGNIFLWKMFWFILISEKIRRNIRRNGIKVDRKRIVFEDYDGDPNTFEVFLLLDYMLAKGLGKKYRLAIVTDRPKALQKYKKQGVTVIGRKTSDGEHVSLKTYVWEAKARFVFFHDICTVTSTKKDEQTYIQLCPQCDLMHRPKAGGLRVILDYAILSGPQYIYEKSEYLDWMEEHMLPLGRPIYDYMLGRIESDETKAAAFSPEKSCNLFWEPMKRDMDMLLAGGIDTASLIGLPLIDHLMKLKELDCFCEENGIGLYIAGDINGVQSDCLNHNWKAIRFIQYDHLDYFKTIGKMDGYICDYGPQAADFLIFDKPMGYTVADLAVWKEKVGLMFDEPQEMMAGSLIDNLGKLKEFLLDVKAGKDSFQKERRELAPSLAAPSEGYCQALLDYFGIG